jgi:hypothetical protein
MYQVRTDQVIRYRELFCPKGSSTVFYRQRHYTPGKTNAWTGISVAPKPTEWLRHLTWTDRFWLGWSCPEPLDGVPATDYVAFDVDAKSAEEQDDAKRIVHAIVALLGEPWFVGRTPSGAYHVYYRLTARVDLRRIVQGESTGPIANVLRTSGLKVGKAEKLEIYPNGRHNFRGPLGTDQPILDPTTLTSLGLETLDAALDYVEGRLGNPIDIDELEAQARTTHSVSQPRTDQPHDGLELALAYWNDGLPGPGKRDEATGIIIRGLIEQPVAFGLEGAPTDDEIGAAVARWLREKGQRSCDWQAKPDDHYWSARSAKRAEGIRKSLLGRDSALLTQLSAWEYFQVFECSGHGLDDANPRTPYVRLAREHFAFGLLNFAKYAALQHGQLFRVPACVTVPARSVLSRQPEAPMLTYPEHLARAKEGRLIVDRLESSSPSERDVQACVTIPARTVLSQLPGATMLTYPQHLAWAKECGLIVSRSQSYRPKKDHAKGQAKQIVLDLDTFPGFTQRDVQIMQLLHRVEGYHHATTAHAIVALENFDVAQLRERYGPALPQSVFAVVDQALGVWPSRFHENEEAA